MTDNKMSQGTADLRSLTAARVSLPMSGNSVSTSEVLDFQLAHAQARHAVHAEFRVEDFVGRVRDQLPVLADHGVEVMALRSRATDRATYLRNPQMGRLLDAASAASLKATGCDLAVTIADGLSSLAVERNAIPLLSALVPRLLEAGWSLSTLTVVVQGRVGIGDVIGEGLGASCSLVLIGERPGLSAADSMGAYLTWEPRIGRTDAERNCVSNIRDVGLDAETAAARMMWLMQSARAMNLTGVALKEGARTSLLKD